MKEANLDRNAVWAYGPKLLCLHGSSHRKCLVLHQREKHRAQAIAAINRGELCKSFIANSPIRRLLERGPTDW